jgi:hypothetical protein
MAQIHQYMPTVEADTLRYHEPDAKAEDFPGGGTGLSDIASGIQDDASTLQGIANQDEVAHVGVAMSAARAQWGTELTKRVENGTLDPTAFTTEMNNATQSIGDGLATRAGQLAFQEKQAEMVSSIGLAAGEKYATAKSATAIASYGQMSDNWRNAAEGDPLGQYSSVLREAHNTLYDPNGPYANMPEATRIKLDQVTKSNITMSMLEGEMRIDPRTAMTMLDSGDYDTLLDGNQKYMLQRKADRYIAAQEADGRLQDRLAKEAQTAAQQETANKLYKGIMAPNTTVTNKDIVAANMPWQKQDELVRVLAREQSPEALAAVSHQTAIEAFHRIYAPPGDPDRITDESQIADLYAHREADGSITGKMTKADFQSTRQEFENSRSGEGMQLGKTMDKLFTAMKGQFSRANMSNVDGEGDERNYNYQFWVHQQVAAYQKAGKDPMDLFIPTKPEFVGAQPIVDSFQTTLTQQIENLTRNKIGTGAGPPAPVVAPPVPAAVAPRTEVEPAAPARTQTAQFMSKVIDAQESGGNDNARTSSTGAVGRRQMEQETFDRFKKPGEDIHDPKANVAVSDRLIDYLDKLHPNDPARVATGYFSGEGNISAHGEAKPYVADKSDGHTLTSKYVSDIQGRFRDAVRGAVERKAISWDEGAAFLQKNGLNK